MTDWSTLKKLIWLRIIKGGGSAVLKTVTGSLIHITDALALPAEALSVNVEPIQDLHGYDSPWPAGGGVNILPFIGNNETKQGVTVSYDEAEQCYTLNGTMVSVGNFTLSLIPPSQLPITENLSGSKYYTLSVRVVDGSMTVASGTGITFAVSLFNSNSSSYIRGDTTGTNLDGYIAYSQSGATSTGNYQLLFQCWREGTVFDNLKIRVQIEIADNHVPTVWHPYENICPISGRTSATIYHSGADTSNPTTYTIQFGDTVYGGTLDVTQGKMVVTHMLFNRNSATMNNSNAYPGWNDAGLKALGYTGSRSGMNTLLNIGSEFSYNCDGNNDILFFGAGAYHKTQEEWKALALDIQIVIPLVTPIEITLTPTQIEMLLGGNNLWSDAGDSTLTYYAEGEASTSEALGILLGGTYNNPGGADDVSDDEALGILLGGS